MQNYTLIVIVVICSSILLLILGSLVVNLSLQYQKRQILNFNKIDQLKIDYEKGILDAQLEIQEATFLNIAQEIHDNVGLGLTLAKLNINTIDSDELSRSRHLLVNTSDLISKALTDLADLSKSINADVISNVGFVSSIESEINRIQRNYKFEVEFLLRGEAFHLDSKKEIIIFRIFQESINNIFKHAFATKISVILDYSQTFTLCIQDNGVGFDPEKILEIKRKSSGIRGIQKRATLIDADFEIKSSSDNGTIITIKLNPK